MTATRFLVTDLARELRWQYRRQSVKAFTDIIAELEKREGTKDVVEYSTEYLFALHVAKAHPDDHRALEQGVSGFLCLGRLFQGQPNEAALCI